MSDKQSILTKIRSALSDVKGQDTPIPPVPEVWKTEGLPTAELSVHFQTNLETVKGELVRCTDLNDAAQKISDFFAAIGAEKIAVLDRPLSKQVAEKLTKQTLVFPPDNAADITAKELSVMDAGLVSPEYLLSDTGSCLFAAPAAFDRLTTYITPVSVVIADETMLRENLPTAWQELTPRLKTATTGEFVIVTGPSRTADIEKILVLGVHGPRRLVVFLTCGK
jgi:L-lactate dehydrogenase complex protein LldG